CYKCHVRRGEAKPQPIIPGAKVGPALSETYGRGAVDTRKGASAALALLIGLPAAVLFTGLWYYAEAAIRLGRGRIAEFVGVAIAFTVLTAGTLFFTRRPTFMLPIISFALTVAAVVAGEYLIISQSLVDASGAARWDVLQLASPDQVVHAAG